jgi:hypothetical protein
MFIDINIYLKNTVLMKLQTMSARLESSEFILQHTGEYIDVQGNLVHNLVGQTGICHLSINCFAGLNLSISGKRSK